MTAKEMIPAVGAQVTVRCEGLLVQCMVRDVKHVYGKARLLVAPCMGDGEQWIELSRTGYQRLDNARRLA